MKGYEIVLRDIQNTNFGKRFVQEEKEWTKGHTSFLPNKELEEEFNELGLFGISLLICRGCNSLTFMVGSAQYNRPIYLYDNEVFDAFKQDSISELFYYIMNNGEVDEDTIISEEAEALINSRKSHGHSHDHEDEDSIPTSKKSSNEAPKAS